jgi:hypothetical protein
MILANHLLALQNTTQREGGSLGVPGEIIIASAIACALLTATVLLLTRYRHKKEPMVLRERDAREQMQVLCPDGWSARIVIYGSGAPMPDDAPPSGEQHVCIEWAEYEHSQGGNAEVAVARRMWSRTITGALRGMIADRQLDLELEEIERRVIQDDDGGGETGPSAAGAAGSS